ncbi:hypothetical protein AC579_4976 [Pseudocercospora musae]|uniref:Reverse transcriptase domain-containing protein n=1 Tax=Pseudocercospora musae TaxID=113226 RepID=A0A139IFZ0_9PEZI|nr:hypothetical protein AC579_4976 [Pseudocercospora musae]
MSSPELLPEKPFHGRDCLRHDRNGMASLHVKEASFPPEHTAHRLHLLLCRLRNPPYPSLQACHMQRVPLWMPAQTYKTLQQLNFALLSFHATTTTGNESNPTNNHLQSHDLQHYPLTTTIPRAHCPLPRLDTSTANPTTFTTSNCLKKTHSTPAITTILRHSYYHDPPTTPVFSKLDISDRLPPLRVLDPPGLNSKATIYFTTLFGKVSFLDVELRSASLYFWTFWIFDMSTMPLPLPAFSLLAIAIRTWRLFGRLEEHCLHSVPRYHTILYDFRFILHSILAIQQAIRAHIDSSISIFESKGGARGGRGGQGVNRGGQRGGGFMGPGGRGGIGGRQQRASPPPPQPPPGLTGPRPVSHTQSSKWIAPRIVADQAIQAQRQQQAHLNRHQGNFCPRSDTWPQDYDINTHRTFIARDRAAMTRHVRHRNRRIAQERIDAGLLHEPPAINPPFNLRHLNWENNFSSVLALPTIFVINQHLGRTTPEAAWPEPHEQKYEGDERIATDPLHGRFLPHPRVPGNGTVNWQQRSFVPQQMLENFHYPIPDENEILLRSHRVDELEVSDEIGAELIGEDLMERLDELWEEEEEGSLLALCQHLQYLHASSRGPHGRSGSRAGNEGYHADGYPWITAGGKKYISYAKAKKICPKVFALDKDLKVDFMAIASLNRITITDAYPMPLQGDVLSAVHGAKFISTIDMKAFFHQWLVKQEDRHKLSMVSHRGQEAYNVAVMGYKNVPPYVQRQIDRILRTEGVNGFAKAFVDDIVIYSLTLNEHLEHLDRVFSAVDQNQLTILITNIRPRETPGERSVTKHMQSGLGKFARMICSRGTK